MNCMRGRPLKHFWNARVALPVLAVGVVLTAASFAPTSWAQVVGTPELQVARAGHTATLLADGRILIVGGETANGPVSQAEIFDPASGGFSVVGSSVVARADHTATLLGDGRVLIAGGRHFTTLLDATELFDPASGSFVALPQTLRRPRAGHSATVLADGTLLIAGGDDAGSAEILDPATASSTLLPALLAIARAYHAATLVESGSVLIVGGVGRDNSPLDSVELFDPATVSFDFTAPVMQVARVQPDLRLLPDGKVQVIGGSRDNSLEVFDPAAGAFGAYVQLLNSSSTTPVETILQAQTRAALFHNAPDASLVGAFAPLLDRESHSLTEMPGRNEALVAGGLNTNGQPLQSAAVLTSSSASVTADKIDYPPGDIVVITGTGWQPGEPVSLVIHEEPTTYGDVVLSAAVAGANGTFTNTE